jgi:hypothetical protein
MMSVMSGEPEHPAVWFMTYEHETDAADPPLTGACAALRARLRELIPVWHELGIVADDTIAVHDAGRLFAIVDLRDGITYAELRVEVTETSWAAAWVRHPSNTVGDLADAVPYHRTGGDTDVVESAVGWLRTQLELPITYREWRRGEDVVAYNWSAEGRVICQFETPPPDLAPAITRRARP